MGVPGHMRMKMLVLLALCLGVSSPVCVQAAESRRTSEAIGKDVAVEARMQWFKYAKFGVFIHWGIYAVDGVSESWSFFNTLP